MSLSKSRGTNITSNGDENPIQKILSTDGQGSQIWIELTGFKQRHESDLEEVVRNFRREPPERFVDVEDEMVLLKRAHHQPVHLPVVQNAHQDDAYWSESKYIGKAKVIIIQTWALPWCSFHLLGEECLTHSLNVKKSLTCISFMLHKEGKKIFCG